MKMAILSLLTVLVFGAGGLVPLPARAQKLDTANSIQTFTVGRQPTGIAFDGSSISVANFGSNTVSKISNNYRAPSSREKP